MVLFFIFFKARADMHIHKRPLSVSKWYTDRVSKRKLHHPGVDSYG